MADVVLGKLHLILLLEHRKYIGVQDINCHVHLVSLITIIKKLCCFYSQEELLEKLESLKP